MKIAPALFHAYLLLLMAFCTNMGESKQQNALSTVAYHDLREKEGCFHAVIQDDGNSIEVRNFSFAGYATLGGVLRESDDSTNRLDLAQIKEITIVNKFYMSDRYKNLELLQASVTTKNNKKIEDLLIPRKVEISGIEISTQIQKAWPLSKIEKIVIKGPCDAIKEEPVQKKSEEAPAKKPKAMPQQKRSLEEEAITSAPKVHEEKQVAPTQETAPTQTGTVSGIWSSLTTLLDAIIGVFKAFFNAIVNLFRSLT